jgi:hypothetical protein
MAPVRLLYQVPLAEFVKARDALARELRDKGEADEAKRIATLRKPAAALWVANQLARAAPKEIGALITATARARHAQAAATHGKGGDELREAMREQREALQKLSHAAAAAALSAGMAPNLALQRRVQSTVQTAAASDPEALREGRLERELEPMGFGDLVLESGRQPPADDGRQREADAERKRVQRELKKAEERAQRLAASAEQAEKNASRAEEAAARLRERATAARRESDEAGAAALALRRRS